MPQNYKKRRAAPGPSKNELRAARGERDDLMQTRAGTLRQRFPHAKHLEIEFRVETPAGAVLEQVKRTIDPDEPLLLDIPCPGGCGGGHFLLTSAIEALLEARQEGREGMAICQAASYKDPTLPCDSKLYYRIGIEFGSEDA